MSYLTKQRLKKKFPGNNAMHVLIDYIDKTVFSLYQEYLNNATDPSGEFEWKKNIVDLEVKMVAAMGHGHEMHGDLSTILGAYGNITQAYREIIMGGYATNVAGNSTTWTADDRLLTIGKGVDADNREDALTLYKSGFLELMNAVVIGAFSSGGMSAKDGAVQYIDNQLQLYFNDEWHPLAFVSDIPKWAIGEIPTGLINGSNKTFTLAHTPIGNVALTLYPVTRLLQTDFTINGKIITLSESTNAPINEECLIADYQYSILES
jgi:hypothetical protein